VQISEDLLSGAQSASSAPATVASSADDPALPDAPEGRAEYVSPEYPGPHPYLHRVVKADMGPQPLTAEQKIELSLISPLRPMSFGASLFSAGWSHLNDSRPHYGVDRGAFGERLGAAKVKQMSENFFSYGVFAAAFHEDPHYYVMGPGPGHSIQHRAIYAATRVVLTRKDDGSTGINWAKLVGVAASNALANAYYPDRDRGVKSTLTAYVNNLWTTAATIQLDEFLPDVIHLARHKKGSR